MEGENTIAIVSSISGMGGTLASGTSMEAGTPLWGSLQLSGTQQSSRTTGGIPLGWYPYLLHPGVLALGSLWMRQTWKHPRGPTHLLRGIRLFNTTLDWVTALLGFSRFVGYTSYSSCLLRGMNLYQLQIFLSFFYCMASQGGSTSPTYPPTPQ